MNCGVYLITNKSNNKVYVGKSIILKYRWKKHLWKLKQGKHHNLHLQSAFNKDGIETVLWEFESPQEAYSTAFDYILNDLI